ncbi:hypothetical protein D3C87_1314100 [compost metagenome]
MDLFSATKELADTAVAVSAFTLSAFTLSVAASCIAVAVSASVSVPAFSNTRSSGKAVVVFVCTHSENAFSIGKLINRANRKTRKNIRFFIFSTTR